MFPFDDVIMKNVTESCNMENKTWTNNLNFDDANALQSQGESDLVIRVNVEKQH